MKWVEKRKRRNNFDYIPQPDFPQSTCFSLKDHIMNQHDKSVIIFLSGENNKIQDNNENENSFVELINCAVNSGTNLICFNMIYLGKSGVNKPV